MAEWIVCPHCQLKHTHRPDRSCPRCHRAIEQAAVPPAAVPEAAAPTAAPPPVANAPLAGAPGALFSPVQIAGVVSIVNGLVNLVLDVGPPAATSGPRLVVLISVIDVLLGGALVAEIPFALELALLRTAVGALVIPLFRLAQGNLFYALLQLVFSLSVLALLWRRPDRPRVVAGVTGAAVCLAMQVVGGTGMHFGYDPFGRLAWLGQVASRPVRLLEGTSVAYRMEFPPGWYLRRGSMARKDNSRADRWVVRPDADAEVVVVVERRPDTTPVDMDRFEAAVTGTAAKHSNNFLILDEAFPSSEARLVHTRSRVEGVDIESIYGLFHRDACLIQVLAFSRKAAFVRLKAELWRIVRSFDLPADGAGCRP
jgi:hypothetical protein